MTKELKTLNTCEYLDFLTKAFKRVLTVPNLTLTVSSQKVSDYLQTEVLQNYFNSGDTYLREQTFVIKRH